MKQCKFKDRKKEIDTNQPIQSVRNKLQKTIKNHQMKFKAKRDQRKRSRQMSKVSEASLEVDGQNSIETASSHG